MKLGVTSLREIYTDIVHRDFLANFQTWTSLNIIFFERKDMAAMMRKGHGKHCHRRRGEVSCKMWMWGNSTKYNGGTSSWIHVSII